MKNLQKKIKDLNLNDINTIFYLNDSEITQVLKQNIDSITKIKEELPQKTKRLWLKNEIKKVEQYSNPLNSGSNNIDSILDGGFFPGKIYLIFGEFNTGKTQLCHQLATNIFFKEISSISNSIPSLTLYLDTENTFRPERIKQLASSLNEDSESVLNSIDRTQIIGSTALTVVFDKIEDLIQENKYKLLVIDSITNHFRTDLNKEGINASMLKNNFIKILGKINEITKRYNLITILTSQITPAFYKESLIPVKPVALDLFVHFFSEFIYLSNLEENQRLLHVINSEILPERKCLFIINQEGIRDYKLLT